jgi:hypothetical protein
MTQSHQKAAERVAKQRARAAGSTSTSEGTTNRAQQKGESAGNPLFDKADEMGEKMGMALAERVFATSWSTCLKILETGNFGERADKYYQSLDAGIDQGLEQANFGLEQEIDPKYLMQSSESCMKQLPPSLEIESD